MGFECKVKGLQFKKKSIKRSKIAIWHNSWIFYRKFEAMYKKIFFLVTVVAIFSSCATHKYSQINHAKFYEQDYSGNVFKSTVFNTNDSISELFVQVDLNALAVLSGKSKADALKEYIFEYSMVDGAKEKEVLQTGRINLTESPDNSDNHLSFKVKLHTQPRGHYVLFTSLEDKMATKAFISRSSFFRTKFYAFER